MESRKRAVAGRTRHGIQTGIERLEQRTLLSAAIAALGTQQTFLSGNNPLSITLSDVNRDGKLDAIVANNTGDTVTVLLNDGTGQFPGKQPFPAGVAPISVAAADVNGDGKPDLVVADYHGDAVSVLTGNGDGTFSAPATFATGHLPIAVITADINGDGHIDLLVANYTAPGSSVSILLGNGNGTFVPQTTVDAGSNPISLTTADLNGDGKLDLAVTNYASNTVSILTGTGNGSFAPRQTFATSFEPRSVATADMNRDGKIDLIVSNRLSANVSVLLGNGNATFSTQTTYATDTGPRAVSIADMNEDGKPDVVIASEDGNVAILLGNGDGLLQPQKTFGAGNSPYWLVTGDVNGDGRPDVVAANRLGNNISVLLGDVPPMVLAIDRTAPLSPIVGPGVDTVSYTVRFNESVSGVDASDFTVASSGVSAATPVDVSGSGSNYTISIHGISGQGALRLNLIDDGSISDAAGNPLQPGGAASFQTQQTFATGTTPFWTATGDLNEDGRVDAIVANIGGSVSVLLGNGDGTFALQQTVLIGSGAKFVKVVDVNGDGKLDLIAGGGLSVAVLLGNGNGSFGAPHTFSSLASYSIAPSDVNGDGLIDLVVPNSGGPNIGVLLGNGNGSFSAPKTYFTYSFLFSAVVGDLNGDGIPDLAVGGKSGGPVGILIGNGNGTFQTQKTYALTTAGLTSVSTADVNGDGTPDLVAGLGVPYDLSVHDFPTINVLLGNGDGTFQARATLAGGQFPLSTNVVDINGDGRPDIVAANYNSVGPNNPTSFPMEVSVLLGNGDGTFQNRKSFEVGRNPISVTTADFNRDGRLDLIVANDPNATVSALMGTPDGSLDGQTYTFVTSQDVLVTLPNAGSITLVADLDAQHIDWTYKTTTAQLAINDPNGLTITSGRGGDDIVLDYSNGNPFPNMLHLNGSFTIDGMQWNNPLANTNLEIGKSTVYVRYPSGTNAPAILQQYLQSGYNGGGWNGVPTAGKGVITSAAAAAGFPGVFGVGSADAVDFRVGDQLSNAVELQYTLMGDANLDGAVNGTDALTLGRNYLATGSPSWDQGNFNYDATIDLNDALFLRKNYNAILTPSIASDDAGVDTDPPAQATTPSTPTSNSSSTPSSPSPSSPISPAPSFPVGTAPPTPPVSSGTSSDSSAPTASSPTIQIPTTSMPPTTITPPPSPDVAAVPPPPGDSVSPVVAAPPLTPTVSPPTPPPPAAASSAPSTTPSSSSTPASHATLLTSQDVPPLATTAIQSESSDLHPILSTTTGTPDSIQDVKRFRNHRRPKTHPKHAPKPHPR